MDFDWTDEQRALRDRIIQFARCELSDDFARRDAESRFSRELWNRCAAFGVQGLPFPKEYGGSGHDVLTTALAMEALGYACPDLGLLVGLNGQMWTVQLMLLTFGDNALKQRYLPGLCDGGLIGGQAMTEPDFGSDVFSLKTRAEKVDGGWRLTGEKRMITLAPVADLLVVFATVDPKQGAWGVSAFLVETASPGCAIEGPIPKMGLRTLPMGHVRLDNCTVPDSHLLGKPGSGAAIINHSLEWERACLLASQVGAMERQLEAAIKYVRRRHQFGQPIGKFQSVANRIADMKVRLETARLAVYRAAWMKQKGRTAAMEAAIAKLHVGECAVTSSLDAVRQYGGRGYLVEHGVEAQLRDAVGGVLYSGTSDIQRQVIAQLLGL